VTPINTPTWPRERNPDSVFVDTAGNQLPYIDKVVLTLAENLEVLNLRAIAGVTYALVDKSYKPDAAAGLLEQWQPAQHSTIPGPHRYQATFPYLAPPQDGFHTPSS